MDVEMRNQENIVPVHMEDVLVYFWCKHSICALHVMFRKTMWQGGTEHLAKSGTL